MTGKSEVLAGVVEEVDEGERDVARVAPEDLRARAAASSAVRASTVISRSVFMRRSLRTRAVLSAQALKMPLGRPVSSRIGLYENVKYVSSR